MNQVVALVKSPVWWTSVVIAGIAINLISAYIKPILDGGLSRAAGSWRERSRRRSAAREALITSLRVDKHRQVMQGFTELRYRMRAVFFLVSGVTFMAIATEIPIESRVPIGIVALLVSALSLFFAYLSAVQAIRETGLLLDANEVPKDNHVSSGA